MDGSLGNMSPSGFDDYSPKESAPAPTPKGADSAMNKRNAFKNQAKNKRRSKNDIQGRNYKCNECDKSYLSYPALYTHKKQKHNGGMPIGKRLSKSNSVVSTTPRAGRPPKPKDRIDARSDKYFDAEEYKASDEKADFLTNYREVLDEFKLGKLSLDNKIFVTQLNSDINPLFQIMRELHDNNATSNDLKDKVYTSDYAFSYYLYHVCEKANPEFYKDICKFVVLYREAFNTYGLDKLIIDDDPSDELKHHVTNLNKRLTDKSLSEIVNSEYLPDVANDLFVFYQFHYKKLGMNKETIKNHTLNFTSWLSKNDLTDAKVIINCE